MYGWTKYGGGKHGLVQKQTETWFCQNCREELHKSVPSFMIELNFGEFGRICSECMNIAIEKKVSNLMDLIRKTKKEHGLFDI